MKSKSSYHHGDLQASLIETATQMLDEGGIESLSLRKLAERIGVSRTATYHHFKNKHDLLCAVAAQGFVQLHEVQKQALDKDALTTKDKYRKFIYSYIDYAINNPAIYELMFGQTLWKEQKSNQTLKDTAYPSFQFHVELIKNWQALGMLPENENTLRLAQVTWGTMHGIARLVIDGIYADASNVDEMCECAVNLFLAAN